MFLFSGKHEGLRLLLNFESLLNSQLGKGTSLSLTQNWLGNSCPVLIVGNNIV